MQLFVEQKWIRFFPAAKCATCVIFGDVLQRDDTD